MPFKIVKTFEDGEENLCIIPSQWESRGILKYPEKSSDFKLYRDGNAKPGRDWPTMPCQVKRSAILTYKQANIVLNELTSTSDKDHGVNNAGNNSEAPRDDNNTLDTYNALAEHLTLNRQYDGGNKPSVNTTVVSVPVEYEFTTPTINTAPVVTKSDVHQRNDNTQILELLHENQNLLLNLLQVYNTCLENQALIAEKVDALSENQKNSNQKIISLSLQIVDGFSRIQNTRRESAEVIQLGRMSDPDESLCFEVKPVDSVEDLNNLELILSDKAQKSRLTKLYSIMCSKSVGNGITCAYKLLDLMFSRKFLCKCSWAGGSRSKDIKVPMKGYQNVINFFFSMVHSWDPTFTFEDNERFLKTVLKNSLKRNASKNIRISTKRTRKRKITKILEPVDKNLNKINEKKIVDNIKTDSSDEVKEIEDKENELTDCEMLEETRAKTKHTVGQNAITPRIQEVIRQTNENAVAGTSRQNLRKRFDKRSVDRQESVEESSNESEEEEKEEMTESDNEKESKYEESFCSHSVTVEITELEIGKDEGSETAWKNYSKNQDVNKIYEKENIDTGTSREIVKNPFENESVVRQNDESEIEENDDLTSERVRKRKKID